MGARQLVICDRDSAWSQLRRGNPHKLPRQLPMPVRPNDSGRRRYRLGRARAGPGPGSESARAGPGLPMPGPVRLNDSGRPGRRHRGSPGSESAAVLLLPGEPAPARVRSPGAPGAGHAVTVEKPGVTMTVTVFPTGELEYGQKLRTFKQSPMVRNGDIQCHTHAISRKSNYK